MTISVTDCARTHILARGSVAVVNLVMEVLYSSLTTVQADPSYQRKMKTSLVTYRILSSTPRNFYLLCRNEQHLNSGHFGRLNKNDHRSLQIRAG